MGKDWLQLMDLKEATLAGRFVVLEPLRMEHARELYPDALEPGLFQHLAPGTEASIADLEAWIKRRLDDQSHGTALPFLQRDATTRKAIGATCMFNISRRHHRVEIGHTWLAKSHRGGRVNAEAKFLLLEHAFKEMGCIRVQFKVDVRNEAGIRALERIGAVREGLMRSERVLTDGHVRDAFVYSIIAGEWNDVRTQLNGLLWAYKPGESVQLKRQPPKIPGLHPEVTPPVRLAPVPQALPQKPGKPAATSATGPSGPSATSLVGPSARPSPKAKPSSASPASANPKRDTPKPENAPKPKGKAPARPSSRSAR